MSFVHLLSGLSPQEHTLTRVAPFPSNLADPATNTTSDCAWNLLRTTFSDKDAPENCYRFCTAAYRAPPRQSTQQGGAGAARTSELGSLYRLGLDLHTSHTAQVCEIKEVRSSKGSQRLVHLRSASIVWRGAMSWSSAEWWPPELQRLVRVNRVQQLSALRKAMAQLVRGEDHELFDFWMLFDDFMAFFHVVQLYQDTISLPQTATHQRGSDDEAGKTTPLCTFLICWA
jgi:hypothetical protein